MGTQLSRRKFLEIIGLTGLGAGGMAALAGCTTKVTPAAPSAAAIRAATTPASAATATAMAGMAMHQSSSDQSGGSADQMTPDQMDQSDADKIKQFLANMQSPITQGKGGLPLQYELDGDVKVFKLTTSAIKWETEPGKWQDAFAYNGMVPGPEIRVTEGDKVRVILTNNLPESTTIHFHGLTIPNPMDGVGNITQPPVKPGQTFVYEFVARPRGTHMYHSHIHSFPQVTKGLLGPFIIEPKDKSSYPKYDREYTLVLNDTVLGFTLNGKSFPATEALTAKQGERILIRYMNEGTMSHPMHLHGMPMLVYAVDGYPLPQPYYCDTLEVAPGNRYEVFVDATEKGVWAFHCHILTHAEGPDAMFGMVTALVVT